VVRTGELSLSVEDEVFVTPTGNGSERPSADDHHAYSYGGIAKADVPAELENCGDCSTAVIQAFA
jgi:hypothetical protein